MLLQKASNSAADDWLAVRQTLTSTLPRGGAFMSKKHLFLSAVAITLLGSAAVLAQGQPQMPMSFFIASTVPGGGNLGGLAGADQICQNLAASSGAGNRTWHAYLS